MKPLRYNSCLRTGRSLLLCRVTLTALHFDNVLNLMKQHQQSQQFVQIPVFLCTKTISQWECLSDDRLPTTASIATTCHERRTTFSFIASSSPVRRLYTYVLPPNSSGDKPDYCNGIPAFSSCCIRSSLLSRSRKTGILPLLFLSPLPHPLVCLLSFSSLFSAPSIFFYSSTGLFLSFLSKFPLSLMVFHCIYFRALPR